MAQAAVPESDTNTTVKKPLEYEAPSAAAVSLLTKVFLLTESDPNFPTRNDPTLKPLVWAKGGINRQMTWTELAYLIDPVKSGPHHLLLGRIHQPDLQRYIDHIARVKQQYVSIEDYVRHTKLGGTPHPRGGDATGTGTGKLECQIVLKPEQPNLIVFQANDFPYATTAEHHDLIWSIREIPAEEEQKLIEARYPKSEGWETLRFVSAQALKSVPGVHHVHVFAKRNTNATPTTTAATATATTTTTATTRTAAAAAVNHKQSN